MITQGYITDEINLAVRVFIYYTDKMLEYANLNNLKYIQWYADSLQIHFLLGALESLEINGNDIYLGAEVVTTDFVVTIFDKVREYWLDEIDSDYALSDVGDITIPTGPTYTPYVADWKYVSIPITIDGTAQITLPFVMDNVDPESLVVTVDDSAPIPSDVLEGYYIENNILYWTYYFELKTVNTVHIKYLQIKGLV